MMSFPNLVYEATANLEAGKVDREMLTYYLREARAMGIHDAAATVRELIVGATVKLADGTCDGTVRDYRPKGGLAAPCRCGLSYAEHSR